MLVLVTVIVLIRHSRLKNVRSDIPPRGYEKLGSGGGYGGGYSSASSYSGRAGSSGGRFQESQLVDLSERRSGNKDDDNDDDDDEDEDIVYMGQDGTVYRKFRYGQLGEDNEDELEYDDESYTFRWTWCFPSHKISFAILSFFVSSPVLFVSPFPRGTESFILYWMSLTKWNMRCCS